MMTRSRPLARSLCDLCSDKRNIFFSPFPKRLKCSLLPENCTVSYAFCPKDGAPISIVMLTDTGIIFAQTLLLTSMSNHSHYFDSLEAAIMIGHQCQAVHRATVFVHERTEYGLTIWKGNVEVFDLHDHPSAKMCYAWRYSEGDRQKIFTILGNKLIASAQKAVQATVCADQQPVKLIPPLTNGLELLRQQMERTRKIIHQVEITSEEMIVSVETLKDNQAAIHQRSRRSQPAAL